MRRSGLSLPVRPALWLAGALVAACALGPAAAQAATVSASGTTVTYSAAGGETNKVTIKGGSNQATIDVVDSAAPLTALGANCSKPNSTTVRCTATSAFTRANVELGNNGDSLLVDRNVSTDVDGGIGPDVLTGGPGADDMFGRGGNDNLFGGANNDRLHGGDDNDTIEGFTGNDELIGYYGRDLLTDGIAGGDDEFSGGPHADLIFATDGGPEVVDCGSGLFDGLDEAHVDAADPQDPDLSDLIDIPIGCEIIKQEFPGL